MSKQQNIYIMEVVHRHTLHAITIPHVDFQTIGHGNFFSISHAEVTEQQLETAIADLEE